jgi:hypothetical protein
MWMMSMLEQATAVMKSEHGTNSLANGMKMSKSWPLLRLPAPRGKRFCIISGA